MKKDIYEVQDRKDELTEILDKKTGWKGQTMVSLDEMKVLLGNNGELIGLNRQAGNCYCHAVEHKGREFFNPTGVKKTYDMANNEFIQKQEYSQYAKKSHKKTPIFIYTK